MTAPAARIAICGAGPVGLALAALLARRGVAPQRIQLIDAKPLELAMRDPRSIALSWGSRQILERVRAFPASHTPIQEIHVSRRGHFGRTMLSSTDHALPALGYVLWLAATGRGHFGASLHDTAFLVGAGAVTAIPLMMYANAAKLIRLSTIGILQYIAPTLIFLTAVLIFHEPFGGVRRIAFPMIWAALAIYSATLLRRRPARG